MTRYNPSGSGRGSLPLLFGVFVAWLVGHCIADALGRPALSRLPARPDDRDRNISPLRSMGLRARRRFAPRSDVNEYGELE